MKTVIPLKKNVVSFTVEEGGPFDGGKVLAAFTIPRLFWDWRLEEENACGDGSIEWALFSSIIGFVRDQHPNKKKQDVALAFLEGGEAEKFFNYWDRAYDRWKADNRQLEKAPVLAP